MPDHTLRNALCVCEGARKTGRGALTSKPGLRVKKAWNCEVERKRKKERLEDFKIARAGFTGRQHNGDNVRSYVQADFIVHSYDKILFTRLYFGERENRKKEGGERG